MPINIKGLQRFKEKVASYNNFDNVCESIAQRIAERGVEIAKDEYSGRTVDIQIRQGETYGNRKVVAKGSTLAFEEFGTGLKGKGTYEGNLPTDTIEFESPKGSPQSTQGWEYYYPNPQTKVNGGWYSGKTGRTFHRGQPAKAQMFNTSVKLRDEIKELAKEIIKGEVK